MKRIYPEYKDYDPNIPDILIQEQIGKHVIYIYAHNVTRISNNRIEAEIIHWIESDLDGDLPFYSVKFIYINMDNTKIYLLNEDEADDVSTKIVLNKLFLR